jgi:hypothetical protein
MKRKPFLMASKEARRLIRESIDTHFHCSRLGVYDALCEIRSNKNNAQRFRASQGEICALAGVRDRTLRTVLADLKRIGVVREYATALRAPSHFELPEVLSCSEIIAERSVLNTERSATDQAHPLPTIEEQEEQRRTQSLQLPLPQAMEGGESGTATGRGAGEQTNSRPLQRRERDQLFDALATACGSNPAEMTHAAARACGVALAEIRQVSPDLTPDEIARRADNYRRHFTGAALTPSALAKHWAHCAKKPHQQDRQGRPITVPKFPTLGQKSPSKTEGPGESTEARREPNDESES